MCCNQFLSKLNYQCTIKINFRSDHRYRTQMYYSTRVRAYVAGDVLVMVILHLVADQALK